MQTPAIEGGSGNSQGPRPRGQPLAPRLIEAKNGGMGLFSAIERWPKVIDGC